mgnify:CR=1 FL=1
MIKINIDIINGKNNNKDNVDSKLDQFEQLKGFGIMILSPLAAGVGLTITAANHVIHLERHWNPAKEDQASDRVYRIGAKKDVIIYHLIHNSENIKTFDDGLNELIKNKKSLSSGTLIPTPTVRDKELVETFMGTTTIEESWALLSPDEFEIKVMNIFEKDGYRCHRTSNIPREYGTDIVAVKNDVKIAIQCKHTSKNHRQNHTALYQLISEAKDAYPDAIYIAATNNYFNDNARDLAKKQNVVLFEFPELVKIDGDSSNEVTSLNKIEESTKKSITFLGNKKYIPWVYKTKATLNNVSEEKAYGKRSLFKPGTSISGI